MIDSHIHLSHIKFNQQFPYLASDHGKVCVYTDGTRAKLIEKCREEGIRACIEPAIELDSNERILDLACHYPDFVFPAVGVHPTRTFRYQIVYKKGRRTEKVLRKKGRRPEKVLRWRQRHLIEKYADHPQVVAIGETGLDYHLERKQQHRIRQMMWFIWQIKLAHKKRLPLILHVREADKDALRILRLFRKNLHGGVYHCFTGDAELAKQYTELGFMIGVGGKLLTHSTRQATLEQTVIQTPLEALLLETDGPNVKPDCLDLKENARNTSLILPAVANRIAELKHVSVEEVMRVTSMNAEKTFLSNDNSFSR